MALLGYAAKQLHSMALAVRDPFHLDCPVVDVGNSRTLGSCDLEAFI